MSSRTESGAIREARKMRGNAVVISDPDLGYVALQRADLKHPDCPWCEADVTWSSREGNPKRKKGGDTHHPDWIQDEGSLGGPGFLDKPRKEQRRLLSRAVKEDGYRSTLGKIMVLNRNRVIKARHGDEIDSLREWLVREYGGPGSFGPEREKSKRKRNPGLPSELLKGISKAPQANPLSDWGPRTARKRREKEKREKNAGWEDDRAGNPDWKAIDRGDIAPPDPKELELSKLDPGWRVKVEEEGGELRIVGISSEVRGRVYGTFSTRASAVRRLKGSGFDKARDGWVKVEGKRRYNPKEITEDVVREWPGETGGRGRTPTDRAIDAGSSEFLSYLKENGVSLHDYDGIIAFLLEKGLDRNTAGQYALFAWKGTRSGNPKKGGSGEVPKGLQKGAKACVQELKKTASEEEILGAVAVETKLDRPDAVKAVKAAIPAPEKPEPTESEEQEKWEASARRDIGRFLKFAEELSPDSCKALEAQLAEKHDKVKNIKAIARELFADCGSPAAKKAAPAPEPPPAKKAAPKKAAKKAAPKKAAPKKAAPKKAAKKAAPKAPTRKTPAKKKTTKKAARSAGTRPEGVTEVFAPSLGRPGPTRLAFWEDKNEPDVESAASFKRGDSVTKPRSKDLGTVLYFFSLDDGTHRAFVAWQSSDGAAYDQFVDVSRLTAARRAEAPKKAIPKKAAPKKAAKKAAPKKAAPKKAPTRKTPAKPKAADRGGWPEFPLPKKKRSRAEMAEEAAQYDPRRDLAEGLEIGKRQSREHQEAERKAAAAKKKKAAKKKPTRSWSGASIALLVANPDDPSAMAALEGAWSELEQLMDPVEAVTVQFSEATASEAKRLVERHRASS